MNKDYTNQNMEPSCMIFTGQGDVPVEPDIAVVRLGVQTSGDSLEEVQTENARLSQSVLQTLQYNSVTDISTSQYQIDRIYDYQDGNRIDRGYMVRNIFEFRTEQMDQVGFLIDSAVRSGANVVEFISFEVSYPDYYYRSALNLAVENAVEKARSVAESLGYSCPPIPVSITEHGAAPSPVARQFASREALAVTPVEPGVKDITAMVTVEFRVAR